MITLESLLNNDNSSIINGECINLEDYSFELSNYTMECSDIMSEINTLEAASIVCEGAFDKVKQIFEKMLNALKEFLKSASKLIKRIVKNLIYAISSKSKREKMRKDVRQELLKTKIKFATKNKIIAYLFTNTGDKLVDNYCVKMIEFAKDISSKQKDFYTFFNRITNAIQIAESGDIDGGKTECSNIASEVYEYYFDLYEKEDEVYDEVFGNFYSRISGFKRSLTENSTELDKPRNIETSFSELVDIYSSVEHGIDRDGLNLLKLCENISNNIESFQKDVNKIQTELNGDVLDRINDSGFIDAATKAVTQICKYAERYRNMCIRITNTVKMILDIKSKLYSIYDKLMLDEDHWTVDSEYDFGDI